MTYYVNESSSAKAGQGAFAIHPDLKSLFCEMLPENLPFNSVPPPSEIVQYLRMSGDKSGPMLAVKEKEELYSPGYHFSNTATDCLPFNFNASTFCFAAASGADSKFLLNSSEFELSAGDVPPNWLSNGSDILALSEDDREGHVPSPAPGDSGNCLHSPQRKLSVIPEVPGFSRPPSLAELAKQKSSNNSLEIIVSGAKETTTSNNMRQSNNNNLFYPSAIPRGLMGYERLQQHSIESSVVTEGHYDASFEDGDMLASFDVDQQNYVYLDEPTILSNGHFKMSQQEMKMLGIRDVITSNGGLGEGKMNSSSNGKIPDLANGQQPTTTPSSTAVSTSVAVTSQQQQANGSSSHRKGRTRLSALSSK